MAGEVSGLRLRLAEERDAEFLLRVRSDPETVWASRRRAAPDPDLHALWLAGLLADPRRALYVAEELEAPDTGEWARWVPVGYARVDDSESGSSELSLALAPEARGRGLARRVIKATVALTPRRAWCAEVRRESVRSLRAFLAAGWRPCGFEWRGDASVAAGAVPGDLRRVLGPAEGFVLLEMVPWQEQQEEDLKTMRAQVPR